MALFQGHRTPVCAQRPTQLQGARAEDCGAVRCALLRCAVCGVTEVPGPAGGRAGQQPRVLPVLSLPAAPLCPTPAPQPHGRFNPAVLLEGSSVGTRPGRSAPGSPPAVPGAGAAAGRAPLASELGAGRGSRDLQPRSLSRAP